MDEVLITLIRADNTERKLMLEPEEIIKILKTINDIEYKLISRALVVWKSQQNFRNSIM